MELAFRSSGMIEGFDQKKIEEYREEARRRWDSELVDESHRRTAKYTKEDWVAIQAETNAIQQGLASLMDRDPADPEVQKLIDRHFRQINERYYTCTIEIYRGLGDLYVNDERFKANYEMVRQGLAEFMRAAMHVYCDRMAADRRP
ncbi:MAG: TipAS antibiotic-recognition domain-containing protein [Chloroflexi bacterium]|nr:TipAS antibiotic-recognition domain-containing protein [Chloroflexota bacterium]